MGSHESVGNDEFLTGLTGYWVNPPRARERAAKPVRPVRGRRLTGPDGSDYLPRDARTHMECKPVHPSDPSGSGCIAGIVHEPGADLYHLTPARRIRIGQITCIPGEPLCGTPARLQPCPAALFPVELKVTCWMCAAIARRDGIATERTGAA